MAKKKYNDTTSNVTIEKVVKSPIPEISDIEVVNEPEVNKMDSIDTPVDIVVMPEPIVTAVAIAEEVKDNTELPVTKSSINLHGILLDNTIYDKHPEPVKSEETPVIAKEIKEVFGEELIMKLGEETTDPTEYVEKVHKAFSSEGFSGLCLYLKEHGNYAQNTYIVNENKLVGFGHLFMVVLEKNQLSTRLALRFLMELLKKSNKIFTENIERSHISVSDAFLKKSIENTVKVMLILNIILGKSVKYTPKTISRLIESMKVSIECKRDILTFCNMYVDM